MLSLMTIGRSGRHRMLIGLLFAILGAIGAGSGIANAQDDDGVAEIKGSLVGKDETGERVGIGGVTFTASDLDGVEVARTTSAEDGSWSLSVPAGTFDVRREVGSQLNRPFEVCVTPRMTVFSFQRGVYFLKELIIAAPASPHH